MYQISVSSLGCSARGDFKHATKKVKNKIILRGVCNGMSNDARRRLVRYLGSHTVLGRSVFAITLTVRMAPNPVEWRDRFRAFTVLCNRDSLPFVWRVELQRRGVPHLHLIFWGSAGATSLLKNHWLAVWGLLSDKASQDHAVDIRPCDAGWFLYTIFHQFKHCDAQAGWLGKHWGIVNRKMFSPIEQKTWLLSNSQFARFRSIFWFFARRRGRKQLTRWAGFDDLAFDQEFLVKKIVNQILVRRPVSPFYPDDVTPDYSLYNRFHIYEKDIVPRGTFDEV